ncbi:MAG TPA: rhamnulokinase family protein [Gaiellales bacterium]|nr:rhamnulokinase family protein [Gaiellales bacterium]
MTRTPVYAAIDLGAESGRVLCGHLTDGRVELEEANRFPNRPVRLPDGLRWNLLSLFSAALDGLHAAAAEHTLRSVGVDAWGVDYALLDERGRVLGLPFHYRDERTVGMVERAHARVPSDQMYRTTGIQTMPINTVFQLLAEEDGESLAAASRIALVPDLLVSWFSGVVGNEATAASTTGLLDARSGGWAGGLIEQLGLPRSIFGEIVEPGTVVGALLPHHELGAVPVCAVAAHDTASAFVAAPLRDRSSAVLSSGTWSLLGLEVDEPSLGEDAQGFNLSNERGIDGTTRLLRNVMGLWLLQESRRALEAGGARAYEDLLRLAEAASDDVPLFDPDDEDLLRPGDMPLRIANACVRAGQRAPESTGELVRSILVSLACKYRLVLERLEQVSGRSIETIHVIGGGARNAVLCQITADVLGRRVLAGPVEATALGNVLVQARAAGELSGLDEMRAVAAASAQLATYEPRDDAAGDETYARFLQATALQAHERTKT